MKKYVFPIQTVGEMVYVILLWITQNIALMVETAPINMQWITGSHVKIMNAATILFLTLLLKMIVVRFISFLYLILRLLEQQIFTPQLWKTLCDQQIVIFGHKSIRVFIPCTAFEIANCIWTHFGQINTNHFQISIEYQCDTYLLSHFCKYFFCFKYENIM